MKSVRRIVSVVLATALLAAGCGSKPETKTPDPAGQSKPAPSQSLTPATVKVGNVSSLLFAPLYIAIDKGYFEEQKLTVSLENLQTGQDAMVFLANGQLDFVLAGYSAAIFNAVSRGLDLKVIAPMGIAPQQGEPSPLMVRADLAKSGAIKSAKDLKGKKIAAAGGLGATGSYLAAKRLEKVGLTLADVELVNVGLNEQEAALTNKAVDAAMMSEPYSSKAVTDGAGIVVDQGALAGTNASGLLTSGAMLKDKNDVVVRFTAAIMKAAQDIQGDKFKSDENIKIFSKYTKLQPDVLKNVTPYYFDPNLNVEIAKKDLASLQEIMTKAGVLKLQSPVDIAKVIDAGPAAAAAKQLGAK
jgi:NitT/TauT family transport system substrate-binding protein